MTKRRITVLLVFILFIFSTVAQAQEDNNDMFTIGILTFNTDTTSFLDEMTSLGYIEGENIQYISVSYEGIAEEETMNHYLEQRQIIIASDVDIFLVDTDTDAIMLQAELTDDTPIVFGISDDPVATGAVADLITPGSNITGVVTNQHHPRRLQLLTEIYPETSKIYYLYSTQALEGELIFNQVQALGEELGIEVVPAPLADVESGIEALENIPEDTDWIFLTPYVPFHIPEFANVLTEKSQTLQVPIAGFFGAAIPDYLIGYGPDISITARQAANIIDLILRGANPADISVVTAENSLVVNLEAAEGLDWEIPVTILRQANLIVREGYFDELYGTSSDN